VEKILWREKKMSDFNNNEYPEETGKSKIKEEEKSANKIIEDYLNQIRVRLPTKEADEIISEIKSHLIEKATQTTGQITTKSAWDAIVSMGNPELLAREFRIESKTEEEGEKPKGFIESLQPKYRNLFWRIFIILISVDLVTLAVLASLTIATLIPILNFVSALIGIQVIIFINIGIVYFILLYLSYPEGTPIEVIFQKIGDNFRNFFEEKDWKEHRVKRVQKKVERKVTQFEKYTNRKKLIGETIGNIIGGVILFGISFILLAWYPAYPTLEIEFLQLVGALVLTRAVLSGIRAVISSDNLPAARILASINVLYGIIGIYFFIQFFYGPLSFPVIITETAGSTWTLFYWKPYIEILVWLVPIIIVIIIVAMIYEIVQINMYLKKASDEINTAFSGYEEKTIKANTTDCLDRFKS
jgi:MFS family permease